MSAGSVRPRPPAKHPKILGNLSRRGTQVRTGRAGNRQRHPSPVGPQIQLSPTTPDRDGMGQHMAPGRCLRWWPWHQTTFAQDTRLGRDVSPTSHGENVPLHTPSQHPVGIDECPGQIRSLERTKPSSEQGRPWDTLNLASNTSKTSSPNFMMGHKQQKHRARVWF